MNNELLKAIVKTCPLCGERLIPFSKSEGNVSTYWDVCVCGYESEKEIVTMTTASSTNYRLIYKKWRVDIRAIKDSYLKFRRR